MRCAILGPVSPKIKQNILFSNFFYFTDSILIFGDKSRVSRMAEKNSANT